MEAGDKWLHSNGHGWIRDERSGSRRHDGGGTNGCAQTDTVGARDKQSGSKEPGGGRRRAIGLKRTWWRWDTSGCAFILTVGVRDEWSDSEEHGWSVRQARAGKKYHIAVVAVWPWVSEKRKKDREDSAQEMLASRLTPCLSWLALLYHVVGGGPVRDGSVMVDTVCVGTCWLGSGELDDVTVDDASVSKKKRMGRTQRRRHW